MATTASPNLRLPGPRPVPVIGWRGNFVQFLREPIGYLKMLHRDYGPVSGLVSNYPKLAFVFGPECNHFVLSDQDLFYNMELTDSFFPTPEGSAIRYLNQNLFTMNGDEHRKHRRMALPAFHRKYIEAHWSEIVQITQERLDSWRPGQTLDVFHEMSQLTLRVAINCFLGVDAQRDNTNIDTMLEHSLNDLFKKSIMFFPVNLPGTPYRRLLTITEELAALLRQMIVQKRANIEAHHDVLAMLIQARDEDGSALSDTELVGQAHILVSAGHESSSNALTWTLFLLSQHPAILADVLDEMERVLDGGPPTLEQMNQLPLLDRVLKESLRILSPSSASSRVSTAPFELGSYAFPKGTVVTVSPFVTHHMPELYPEPQTFKPERWETINPTIYEYLPFSAGPRMCIGSAFAIMEFKIVLAMILQRFRLDVAPGSTIDPVVRPILSPKQGMPMTVARQDRRFGKSEVRGKIHELVDLR